MCEGAKAVGFSWNRMTKYVHFFATLFMLLLLMRHYSLCIFRVSRTNNWIHLLKMFSTNLFELPKEKKKRQFMQKENENKVLHPWLRWRVYLTWNCKYLQSSGEILCGVWSLAFDILPSKKRLPEQLNEKKRRRSEAEVSTIAGALLASGASC